MKHTCKKRGTRGRSPGRKEKRKRAVKALAAAGAIAGGTQAYAAPVRFDNPAHGEAGHFHWPVFCCGEPDRHLDITQPADSQPGDGVSPGQVSQDSDPPSVIDCVSYGNTGVELGGYNYYFVASVAADQTIPTSGAYWGTRGYIYYPGYGSELPEGQATYLGVKFDLGAGTQYGWVGVVRDGTAVEAFAWGHETVPGDEIAAGAESAADIPTVSEWGLAVMSLALLAAGAWVVRKRIPQTKPPAAA